MRDLTQGRITTLLIEVAAPIAAGMLFQTMYLLVDLYFVAALGPAAVAGVGAAGTLTFIVTAMSHVLGIGALTLISHSLGRKDRHDTILVFNQSITLSAISAVVLLIVGYALHTRFMLAVSADAGARDAGTRFLLYFLPNLALQFPLITMVSALRGMGVTKPGMVVQAMTVLVNAALAPVLIAGWLTGHPLGVAGAGLASSVSVVIGLGILSTYLMRSEEYGAFRSTLLKPRIHVWNRILAIGLPAGAQYALTFLYMAFVYFSIKDFGAEAQAGFSVGSRLMQAIFLPAMAIAFATSPIAGQNFGARRADRVRETFVKALLLTVALLFPATLILQFHPETLVRAFSHKSGVVIVGADFLRVISWNAIAQGVVSTCSGMFQAIGNTKPALLSSVVRLSMFVALVSYVSQQPGFTLDHVWYLSAATMFGQAALSYALLRRQLRKSLSSAGEPDRPLRRSWAA